MGMETNEKFFKNITSIRKLKKDAKRRLGKFFGIEKGVLNFRIRKWILLEWSSNRKIVNRTYSGKFNREDYEIH